MTPKSYHCTTQWPQNRTIVLYHDLKTVPSYRTMTSKPYPPTVPRSKHPNSHLLWKFINSSSLFLTPSHSPFPVRFNWGVFAREMHSTSVIRQDVSEQVWNMILKVPFGDCSVGTAGWEGGPLLGLRVSCPVPFWGRLLLLLPVSLVWSFSPLGPAWVLLLLFHGLCQYCLAEVSEFLKLWLLDFPTRSF